MKDTTNARGCPFPVYKDGRCPFCPHGSASQNKRAIREECFAHKNKQSEEVKKISELHGRAGNCSKLKDGERNLETIKRFLSEKRATFGDPSKFAQIIHEGQTAIEAEIEALGIISTCNYHHGDKYKGLLLGNLRAHLYLEPGRTNNGSSKTSVRKVSNRLVECGGENGERICGLCSSDGEVLCQECVGLDGTDTYKHEFPGINLAESQGDNQVREEIFN